MSARVDELVRDFTEVVGAAPDGVWQAPGRVNRRRLIRGRPGKVAIVMGRAPLPGSSRRPQPRPHLACPRPDSFGLPSGVPCPSRAVGYPVPEATGIRVTTTQTGGALSALRLLLRSSHLAGPDDLPALVEGACRLLGAVRSRLYLIDYDQVLLVPLSADARIDLDVLSVEGTLAGRAFSDLVQHISAAGGLPTLLTPVLDGTERLGILQMEFPSDVDLDDELRMNCWDLAALVAELVLTRGLYGDAVERTRRRGNMTVPAELQWRLLPPLTFVSPRAAIAGVLAPTAEVAGDSFDYAVNGDVAHVAILDAMGHGVEAALLSALAVSAMRNARRSGADLHATTLAMDVAVAAHFGGDKFVTAIVGELDLATGWWRWITCGHPPALLLRGGQVVKELDDVVSAPLGLGLLGGDLPLGQERLQPGDRLVLYTDGVVEARDAAGDFFGVHRLVELVTRQAASGRPVAESLRRLNHAILSHQVGTLQDDATTVIVEWLTDEPVRSGP